ncbi:tripartite tricarboxylate transporter substrate binding protein [Bacillus sp. ISL-47]|uniref:tripartite tricarboxylate transporter substrate binding protein n=1 Tax=Bacillus sp. ISL-47 TaxID=2819130 RepID=UPI001BE9A539|nr:tripartite tricarboxylate transporter substrate binding protein [Bacillus sp. ISL-47]MBT2689248.1 tripartite tricarboxylate transporter substrate binding protein [Bacillus sp. ISL-47]MBT2708627.1 tripartite tricarboxylate transporter substrate binding protein [Pseudomonas sp. ISL-84]
MMKKIVNVFICFMIIALVAACSNQTSNTKGSSSDQNASADNNSSNASQESKEWSPEGSLEFISSYSPGGGHDTMLRAMVKVMNGEGIIENPITVVNKPGGSGAVGMAYSASKKGEENYIMTVTSSFLTTPLQGNIQYSYKDFTPIARLGLDPYVVLVNAKSGIKNFEDLKTFIETKDPTFGGTSVGSGEHMLAIQMNKALGTEVEYVPFEGDGEVVTALLGGHIDVMANNIGSAIEYVNNGDMIPVAVSSSERLEQLPDVPTFKELGYDIEWMLYRGIYGPPEMPEEAVKWFESKLKELSENPQWEAEYLDKYMVESGYQGADEFESYLTEMNVMYEKNLKELGVIQ